MHDVPRSKPALEKVDVKKKPSFIRVEKPKRCTPASKMIAWDLETTRIGSGTPRPLYLTAYSEAPEVSIALRIESIDHLREILIERFLIPKFYGCRFVAWNSNHFDSYFAAASMLGSDDYIIRPYLTRSKNLRGMRLFPKKGFDPKAESRMLETWEFLDGIAMTGLQGWSLAKFTETFSPDHRKLTDVINWEKEEFDATNSAHREYAYQDSASLWYAMRNAEDILLTHFNRNFGATIGGACIKIFRANIPELTVIHSMGDTLESIIRDYAMRGGFCFCARKHEGPIWKYDLNQAYAAAMRDAKLPAGQAYYSASAINPFADTFIVRIQASKPDNKIPFYCKTRIGLKSVALFAEQSIPDTWITSIEYWQLLSEGWSIEVFESYFFDEVFSMRDFVNSLEHIRMSCEGGPSGATGTMIKAVGNHSYGKTVEHYYPVELLLAKTCPPGFFPFSAADDPLLAHIWGREKVDIARRDYHKPQIGAFITAHVRMVVRQAALIAPENWIYADTDCVVFDRDVTDHLTIHASRYGAWKKETDGDEYRIIAKKVYAEIIDDMEVSNEKVRKFDAHAKGLNVKKITQGEFKRWIAGDVPKQTQVHRQNFIKVMQGTEMFIQRTRKGTAV